MAVTTGRKPASGELEQLRAELAETRAALQCVARIAAQSVAKSGRGPWTDFSKLLREQFAASPADVELFLEIIAGRKP